MFQIIYNQSPYYGYRPRREVIDIECEEVKDTARLFSFTPEMYDKMVEEIIDEAAFYEVESCGKKQYKLNSYLDIDSLTIGYKVNVSMLYDADGEVERILLSCVDVKVVDEEYNEISNDFSKQTLLNKLNS